MRISAFEEAKIVAKQARRKGYVDAEAAREYCIDGEIGSDKFWTRTVSVYVGDKLPTPPRQSPFVRARAALAGIFNAMTNT